MCAKAMDGEGCRCILLWAVCCAEPSTRLLREFIASEAAMRAPEQLSLAGFHSHS